MKLDYETIEYGIELDRTKNKNNFRNDKNEHIKSLIEKSYSFLLTELKKDFLPKAKPDNSLFIDRLVNLFKKDEEERLIELFSLAFEGCDDAQNTLSKFYYDGFTIDLKNGETFKIHQNRILSGVWDFLAAMNGNSNSQWRYSVHVMGHDLEQLNSPESDIYKLLELSAEQGNENATIILVKAYFGLDNDESLKDIKKGIYYGEKLKDLGNHDYDEIIDRYL